jgi:hypothetical protein
MQSHPQPGQEVDMKATKVMIVRHAEKPGRYGQYTYAGVDPLGAPDKKSLTPVGWQRAGGLASLFSPTYGPLQNSQLAVPDAIYAASPESSAPGDSDDASTPGKDGSDPSKRPYQTVLPLSCKAGIRIIDSRASTDFQKMVTDLLSFDLAKATTCTLLIAWQHQDILPKKKHADSIVSELIKQTGGQAPAQVPAGPWPEERYDLVFVFDRPSGSGPFTAFSQVPQMLLSGDSTDPIH